MKDNSLVKIGRPSKYTSGISKRVVHYTNLCLKKGNFPSIEGLAVNLGVGTRTLYDWESLYSDFSQTMGILRDTQRDLLIKNGLSGKYSTSFSIFLLRSIHGFSDNKPQFEATQNNYMNISPELMVDALKIMKEEDRTRGL